MTTNNLYYYGPKLWLIMHKYAYQNNKNNISKIYYTNMITFILQLFPCSICKEHFAEVLKKYPLNRYDNIFVWSFNVHNEVNVIQKKTTSPCISICEKLYENTSDNDLIKATFDVIFTFIPGNCGGVIKNFMFNVAELNNKDIRYYIIESLKRYYDINIPTIDWVFRIYIDMCKRFKIKDPLDKQTCISFFGI